MSKFGSKIDVNSMEFKCAIRLLDDNEVLQCDFNRESKGQYLLDFACKTLNLVERDYFGLRYVDSHKQRNWLDPTRSIIKQVKGLNPIVFCFRVKFYPADPARLKEEITRYFLYLQLRRDLLHGRLYCSSPDAATLMAYVIQSELGDYDAGEHLGNYVSEFKLVLNQSAKLEANVMEIHQNEMRGQTPAQAELNYLRKAAQLETYGIDPHPVKDHKGSQLYLGINHAGIITFQGSRKTQHFKWTDIQKITYEGRMFIVHLIVNEKKHLIGFKCPTISACHYLWRCAVEQRYFFTMNSSNDVPFITTGGGLFSRSCKLRYSGRVEREIMEDMRRVERSGAQLHRSYSTTSAPPSMRAIGRSNTAPVQNNHESPERSSASYHEKVVPYLNYSTYSYSEPGDNDNQASSAFTNVSLPPSLDPFDEEDWDVSMTSSLPTEFDLRPELTPTGEGPQLIKFERPDLQPSPSHFGNSTDLDADTLPDDQISDNNTDYDQKNATQSTRNQRKKKKQRSSTNKFFVIVRTSILSSLLLLLLFSCLLLFICESESDLFSHLRKLPEMVILRKEYYEPLKDSMWKLIETKPIDPPTIPTSTKR